MKMLLNVVVVVSGLTLMSPVMACDKESGAHTQLARQEQAAPAAKKTNVTVAKAEAKAKVYNPRLSNPFE